MSHIKYKLLLFILWLSIISGCIIFCSQTKLINYFFLLSKTDINRHLQDVDDLNSCLLSIKSKVLLSSRFKNLDHLKTQVSIKYDQDYSKLDSNTCHLSIVRLSYISNGEQIQRTMTSGASQNEILNLQKADYFKRIQFVLTHPSAIRQRIELEKAFVLARRRADLFGPGDVAFYDLAEASYRHINTPNLAFQNVRDSSEKGYINTFNHVTAQALITLFFSEGLADFIADLHERLNMPEITSGRFTERQLKDSINSPEDNYVDIINNEIGQKIGLALKEKYQFNSKTACNPILLTAFLNDIQRYYIYALEIGLDDFRPFDVDVIKFSNKINTMLKRA